jgi:hypothetical protein
MLSLNTLKSIRKWRDRLFMLTERVRGRRALPRGKRVLFTPWPDAEPNLRRGFAGTPHSLDFGSVPPGGGDYDVVVPLSIEALIAASGDEVLCRRNPLPLPSASAIRLCDDKSALVERLRNRGFAQHIPGDPGSGRFPYMLKRRWDGCARNAHCIGDAVAEHAHADKVASPDYLRQEWIEGPAEFATHLLQIGGRVRRSLSICYRMHHGRAIRGREHVLLMRRCHSRYVRLFERMLNAAEFEGLCCINYKLREGVPMILEINPRFGFSLGPFFSVFLRSLEWDRVR